MTPHTVRHLYGSSCPVLFLSVINLLPSRCCSLSVLDISGCYFDSTRLVAPFPSLKKLNINGTNIKYISSIFPLLEEVHAARTNVVLSDLDEILLSSPNLLLIDLCNTKVEMHTIETIIPTLSHLAWLNLSSCRSISRELRHKYCGDFKGSSIVENIPIIDYKEVS